MSGCSSSAKPKPFGLEILTSDVTFDGNLACLSVPPDSDLNTVLEVMATAICDFEPPVPVVDAADVTYTGTTVFGCFTLTGDNVEAVIEEIATEICANYQEFLDLEATNIPIGSGYTQECLPGTITSATTITELFQVITDFICDLNTTVEQIPDDFDDTLNDLTLGNDFVASGGTESTLGLFLSIPDSRYFINGSTYTKGITTNIPLTSTSDNYVDYDNVLNQYNVTAVGIGAPAPPIAGGIRLWKLTTDVAGVVSSVDMRNFTWISTSNILDNSISTSKIQALAVTGAKMETIVAAATIGDSDFYTITYDTKGRVTAGSNKVSITGVTDQDILMYNAGTTNWENTSIIGSILPSGTDNQTLRYDAGASNYVASSFILNTGSAAGINVPIGEPLQALTLGFSSNQGFQLGQPTSVSATATGGGALTANTYYYVIVSMDGVGTTVFSTEVSDSVDGAVTTAIDLSWDGQPSAASYRIYRGTTTGVYTLHQDVIGAPTFTDDGSGWIAAAAPVITDISSYGVFFGTSDIIYGDRSVHLTSDAVSITNRSDEKFRLFNLNQYGAFTGLGDISALRIDVDTSIRNTTDDNYGIFINDVHGSDLRNIGISVNTTESIAGLNIGIYVASLNAGAGDGIGIMVEHGGAVLGAVTKNASALLEMVSTTQGLLFPRMSTAQRDAIASPAAGLVIYNTTTSKLNVYTSAWEQITSA